MSEPAFDDGTLVELAREREVRIETVGRDDARHRVIIWVVVDPSRRVLIRSWRGAVARWYREAVAAGTATLVVGRRALGVRVERATDAERIRACSVALEAKYAGSSSTSSMLREEILDTTLELHPA